jgi:hypothetical protein
LRACTHDRPDQPSYVCVRAMPRADILSGTPWAKNPRALAGRLRS